MEMAALYSLQKINCFLFIEPLPAFGGINPNL